jgi:hypothetical protein
MQNAGWEAGVLFACRVAGLGLGRLTQVRRRFRHACTGRDHESLHSGERPGDEFETEEALVLHRPGMIRGSANRRSKPKRA